MSTSNTSLSSTTPTTKSPSKITDYPNLSHVPKTSSLPQAQTQACTVQPLTIKVDDSRDGSVPGFLHIPQNYVGGQTASKSNGTGTILLSGAGGGVVGPNSIYLSIANKLASLKEGVPVMRLDYRFPARTKQCVADTKAAMDYMESKHRISRFVLVGWSFGGAPVFTAGGSDERVVGCATVASQTADTDGIRNLAPKPLLLLHGTADKTLSPRCSKNLYEGYGTKGERRIQLFEGDDHALTRNSLKAEEMLCGFIMRCAGVEVGDGEGKIVREDLIGDTDRVELMKKGGDLKGGERVE